MAGGRDVVLMAGSLNRATLIGHLGAKPDIRRLASGDRVANLSLATGERWRDKASGETRERTEWHRITVWGDGLVGVLERYADKGSKLYVEGRLATRKWRDQSGADRWSTEVVVEGYGGRIILLGDPRGAAGGESPAPAAAYGSHRGETAGRARRDLDLERQSAERGEIDDEIPF